MMDLRWSFFVVSSGKPSAQRKARLRAEHRISAGAGAVGLELSLFQHVAQQLEILSHCAKLARVPMPSECRRKLRTESAG